MRRTQWLIMTTWLWMMLAALPVRAQPPEKAPPPQKEEPSGVVVEPEEPGKSEEAEVPRKKRRVPGFRLQQFQIVPRYDVRARPVGEFMHAPSGPIRYKRGKHFDLAYAEVDLTMNFSDGYEDRLSLFYQFTPLKMGADASRDAHFLNAYGILKFGLGKPVLRFGQFVMPFGNLTEYETHTTILQNLGGGARSLGERFDRGFSVEWVKRGISYWVALTQGESVRGDPDFPKVLTVRLARDFEDAPFGPLRLGFSASHGKLPLLPTFADSMPDGVKPIGFTRKTRFAVDGEWNIGVERLRFEFVGGTDRSRPVNGQFLEWNHPISNKLNVTLQADRWDQFDGNAFGFGFGVEYKLTGLDKVRLAWEYRQGRPTGMPSDSFHMLTLQYLWEFPFTVFSR